MSGGDLLLGCISVVLVVGMVSSPAGSLCLSFPVFLVYLSCTCSSNCCGLHSSSYWSGLLLGSKSAQAEVEVGVQQQRGQQWGWAGGGQWDGSLGIESRDWGSSAGSSPVSDRCALHLSIRSLPQLGKGA